MTVDSSPPDGSSIFADCYDGYPREKARIVSYAEDPLCMLLGLFLTHKSLGRTRDESGSYEIDPVVGHAILPSSGTGGTVTFDE